MDRPSCKMLGIFFLPVFILGQEKLPLHVERISDCVAVIQTETGNSNVAVLASEKGLLMLDAGFSPGFAEEVRSLAQGIFQRDDWYGLIHTNPEILNAGGNAAFAGKHIIAHQEVFQYLLEKSDDLPEYLKSRASEFRDRVDRSRNQLAELEADSERAATLRAWIGLCERIAVDFENGFEVLIPDLTFQNRMTLHLGNVTAHLRYFGKTPEDGQVLAWVPEEGFLWLADVFHAAHILPYGSYGPEGLDATPWLCVLDELLDEEHEIRFICRTNGKGMWTRQALKDRRDLIRDVVREVRDADARGESLREVLDRLCRYEGAFPEVSSWEPAVHPGIVRDDIARMVTGLWRVNHDSAADTLFHALIRGSREDARKLLESIRQNPDAFYAMEEECNASGYRLLEMERKAEALEMFRMTVSLFPGSANAYDSLGEAYLAVGNREKAVLNYRKSLEINPENRNAEAVLERLAKE